MMYSDNYKPNNLNQESGDLKGFPDLSTLPFANLPKLLFNGVKELSNEEEQILFLYSTIAALSGIFTNVKGTYDRRTIYPNLFLMVVAEPATGKSAMLYAKDLIQPIQDHFYKKSKLELSKYKSLSIRYKKQQEPPAFRTVFIPGNSSSSKLIKHLSDNSIDNTPSVLFETEMDTVTITTSSDFGNYSDIIRKVFSSEPISQSRRMNDEYIEVRSPKLSLVLSGTLGQAVKFIRNKEDGLFSRFLVMNFSGEKKWKNMTPSLTSTNLTDYFSSLSQDYFNLWNYISTDDVEVELTHEQWSLFHHFCKTSYDELLHTRNDNTISLVKRHGVMLFKICMVLSAIRKYDNMEKDTRIICDDQDFRTALYLIQKSLNSGISLYDELPASKYSLIEKQDPLFTVLPDEFKRSDAIKQALYFNIGQRTTDRYLHQWISMGALFQPKSGVYKKSLGQMANGEVAN